MNSPGDHAQEIIEERNALRARVAELERIEMELCAQRDRAEDWADKLSEAIALHLGEDIGEHSNANNPWAEALKLITGTRCR